MTADPRFVMFSSQLVTSCHCSCWSYPPIPLILLCYLSQIFGWYCLAFLLVAFPRFIFDSDATPKSSTMSKSLTHTAVSSAYPLPFMSISAGPRKPLTSWLFLLWKIKFLLLNCRALVTRGIPAWSYLPTKNFPHHKVSASRWGLACTSTQVCSATNLCLHIKYKPTNHI